MNSKNTFVKSQLNEKLNSINILSHVKSLIKKMKMNLPQIKEKFETNFCNVRYTEILNYNVEGFINLN